MVQAYVHEGGVSEIDTPDPKTPKRRKRESPTNPTPRLKGLPVNANEVYDFPKTKRRRVCK